MPRSNLTLRPSGRRWAGVMRGVVLLLAGGVAGSLDAQAPVGRSGAPTEGSDWPIESPLELQIELHRRGFSCGSIDGVLGAQTESALRAWQRNAGLAESGRLDSATRTALRLSAPALTTHALTSEELAAVRPVPTTWLGKSEAPSLAHGSALELVAERYRASPGFLKKLNPEIDWEAVIPGVVVAVPAVERADVTGKASRILIRLAAHELEAVTEDGRVLVHFPVSIARSGGKRPVGELKVIVVAPEPNYTFDPEVFPESEEAKQLGRKLILPPGPNNPVGRAWIGLSLPGYGIHGTPDPEKVGRTESHGCFRLANWDAVTLLGLVSIGLPVVVEP